MLNILACFFSLFLVAKFLVDGLNHGLGEGQAGTLTLADQLPLFGGVKQIQGLLVVVEFGLAGGHISEQFMDNRDSLKTVFVMFGGLNLQIFIFLECLFVFAEFHQLQTHVVFGFEPFLREVLLQFSHI